MSIGHCPCQGKGPPDLNFNMNVAHLCLWADKIWENMDLGSDKNNVSYITNTFVDRVCHSSCSALSHAQLFVSPWTEADQSSLSFTISCSLLKLMSIQSVMPSSHPILCRPLILLPLIFPSIRGFSNELTLHIRWPKYWNFSIRPSNGYSGLISFRID